MGPRNKCAGWGRRTWTAQLGPCKAMKRCAGWGRHMWTPPVGPSPELPMGHEMLCDVRETHVDTAIGALGGAPHGATKRCAGYGRHMWTPPLVP
eukprot:1430464-Pyramimonas_sp.AAC.1